MFKKPNEEYAGNRRTDWLVFLISTVVMIAVLIVAPQWVWTLFPFVLTALAGALGRL